MLIFFSSRSLNSISYSFTPESLDISCDDFQATFFCGSMNHGEESAAVFSERRPLVAVGHLRKACQKLTYLIDPIRLRFPDDHSVEADSRLDMTYHRAHPADKAFFEHLLDATNHLGFGYPEICCDHGVRFTRVPQISLESHQNSLINRVQLPFGHNTCSLAELGYYNAPRSL